MYSAIPPQFICTFLVSVSREGLAREGLAREGLAGDLVQQQIRKVEIVTSDICVAQYS